MSQHFLDYIPFFPLPVELRITDPATLAWMHKQCQSVFNTPDEFVSYREVMQILASAYNLGVYDAVWGGKFQEKAKVPSVSPMKEKKVVDNV